MAKPKKEIARFKLDTCLTCGRTQVPTVAQRCIQAPYCYERHRKDIRAARNAERGTEAVNKPVYTIPKQSDKQSKLNAAYSILAKQFKKDNPYCKAVLPGCDYLTTDVHHKKGRGEYLLDASSYLPVCRSCHQWIETNPSKAKEMGLSENRL